MNLSGLPLVVAISGASGVIYGVEMLRVLNELGQETHLILSEAACMNLSIETDYSLDEVKSLANVVYNNKDVGAAVASGSFRTRGMIVAPCTIKTLSAIANSFTANLIVRAADCGAVILPPMPAFYHPPATIMDIVHQSIGKALDQVGIEHNLFKRWTGHDRKVKLHAAT